MERSDGNIRDHNIVEVVRFDQSDRWNQNLLFYFGRTVHYPTVLVFNCVRNSGKE